MAFYLVVIAKIRVFVYTKHIFVNYFYSSRPHNKLWQKQTEGIKYFSSFSLKGLMQKKENSGSAKSLNTYCPHAKQNYFLNTYSRWIIINLWRCTYPQTGLRAPKWIYAITKLFAMHKWVGTMLNKLDKWTIYLSTVISYLWDCLNSKTLKLCLIIRKKNIL